MVSAKLRNVAASNAKYHPLDSVSSKLPTQASAHEWAKSTIKISWININRKPPIIPKYIQVSPNDPSGMKKAPIMPPITRRYLSPQKLKPITFPSLNSRTSLYKPILNPSSGIPRRLHPNHHQRHQNKETSQNKTYPINGQITHGVVAINRDRLRQIIAAAVGAKRHLPEHILQPRRQHNACCYRPYQQHKGVHDPG